MKKYTLMSKSREYRADYQSIDHEYNQKTATYVEYYDEDHDQPSDDQDDDNPEQAAQFYIDANFESTQEEEDDRGETHLRHVITDDDYIQLDEQHQQPSFHQSNRMMMLASPQASPITWQPGAKKRASKQGTRLTPMAYQQMNFNAGHQMMLPPNSSQ